jgi:aerobic carbon-monoxide dehydrogenase small subunit
MRAAPPIPPLLATPPRGAYLFLSSLALPRAGGRTAHPRPPQGTAILSHPGAASVPQPVEISLSVNGAPQTGVVEPRLLLSDFIRHELGLTGTHVGCEHGVCGACTVLLDGSAVRSCLVFAVQADGAEVTTVEGLAAGEDAMHPLQEAFRDAHGLQCGFCTPGILMSMIPFLQENPSPDEAQIREALSGNLCRCTGYENIVQAVALAAERMGSAGGPAGAVEDGLMSARRGDAHAGPGSGPHPGS